MPEQNITFVIRADTVQGQAAIRQMTSGIERMAGQSEKSAQKMRRNFEQIGSKMKAVGEDMRSAGFQLSIGLTAPLTAAATAAVALGTTFEREMTKIVTLVGISSDQVNRWSRDVIELSKRTGVSAEELGRGLFFVTSAGQRGAAAMDVLRFSAMAAATGLGDTATVANAVTSAMQAYAKSGLTARQSTDVLMATVREGKGVASEFAASLGRVIGIASQVGVTFDEVGAFLATFTRLGVNAEEATTALRGILTTMLKPSKEARDQLAAFGLTIEDLRRSIEERGLTVTLVELVETIGDNQDALGAIIPNIRALSGIMGTAGAQAEDFVSIQKSLKKALDEGGETVEGFNKTQETMANQLARLKTATEAAWIELGEALLPTVKIVTAALSNFVKNSLQPAVQWFGKLSPTTQRVIISTAALVAAIGPLLIVSGSLVSSVGSLIRLYGVLTTATTGLIAANGGLAASFATLYAKALPLLGTAGLIAVGGVAIFKTAQAVRGYNQAFEDLDETQRGLISTTQAAAKVLEEKYGVVIKRSGKTLREWNREVTEALRLQVAFAGGAAPPSGDGKGNGTGPPHPSDEEIKRAKEHAAAIKSVIDTLVEEAATFGKSREQIALRTLELHGATEAQKELVRAIFNTIGVQESAKQIAELMNKAIKDHTGSVNREWKEYKKLDETIRRTMPEYPKLWRKVEDAMRQVPPQFDRLKAGAREWGRAMEDAFTSMILHGAGFRDTMRGLLILISEAILKTYVFRTIAESFGGKGGVLGVIGSLFSFALPGRQAGGPVAAGQPVVVGERGREVFVPSTAGQVVPNNRLGGMTVQNFIDARGADPRADARIRRAIVEAMLATRRSAVVAMREEAWRAG